MWQDFYRNRLCEYIYIECNYVKFYTNYIRGQKSDSPHDIIISRDELFSLWPNFLRKIKERTRKSL